MKFERTKCRCEECPLNGMKKVCGSAGADKFSVAIVGAAVGPREEAAGEMFVGAEGAKLKEVVSGSGMIWHLVWKTRVVACDVESIGGLDDVEGKLAYECCLPGFEEELKWLEKQGVKVVVPMGQVAMRAMDIDGKIGKYRGSVFTRGKMVVVPTFEYEFYRNGMWKEELTWINDFQKIWDLSLKKYVKPKEKFNLFPKEEDVLEFVEKAIDGDLLVAVDIETTSLNPYYSKILMVGLAVDGEECLVVPFTKQGGSSYWTMAEESRVGKALKRLFAEVRTMFQNAAFDTWHLEVHGYPVKKLAEDTMLLHHVLNPELKHDLGYIVSVYGKTPYWKEVVLGSETKMIGMEDKEVRTYNARDTVVLHQVLPEMRKHLREVGTEKVYREVSLPLVKALRKMSMAGLPLDKKRLEKLKVEFGKRAEAAEKKLRSEWNLPEAFNLRSGDHMKMLVLGKKPAGYQVVMHEMEGYQKDKRKRRDTKKYLLLEARWNVFNGTEQMYLPNTYAGGRVAKLDGEEFINIQKAALRRNEAIEGLVKKGKKQEDEKKQIERLIEFIVMFREFVDMNKLATTFTGFPVGPDGRIHPSYKIHGTATGRLSCLGADTLIQTQYGAIKIQDMGPDIEWEVLTHKGRMRKSTACKRMGEKLAIRLILDNEHDIICTTDHRFLTKNGWVQAKDLVGKELYYVNVDSGCKQQRDRGASSQSVFKGQDKADAYYNSEEARNNLSNDTVYSSAELVEGAISSRKSSALLQIQDGNEESYDREKSAELEGNCKRQQGTFDNMEWGEARLHTPKNVCRSVKDRCGEDTSGIRSTSYQWEWGGQPIGELGSLHQSSTSESPPYLVRVEGFTPVGKIQVFDLTVKEDHSFIANGMIVHNSASPNAQNFAEEVLVIFKPEQGRVIVKADYSNIELRVLGYLTKEKVIIEAFESGKNIHDVNTKLLFGIEEDDASWHTARKAAKTYVFGRTYGGSVEGIYRQILAKVPELRLSLAYFKKMDAAYFEKLGSYREWCKRVIEEARKTRTSVNAFGRKRFLLGTPDEIERQALNNPVQGTAGEIAERAIIGLDAALEKKVKNALLIGTVHDSILVECDAKDKMKVAKIMKEVMEKKIEINGYEGVFPVDVEIGLNWGEMEKVEI